MIVGGFDDSHAEARDRCSRTTLIVSAGRPKKSSFVNSGRAGRLVPAAGKARFRPAYGAAGYYSRNSAVVS